MPPGYRIRNWERYQHYKYRDPPWIKLHVKILTSEAWVSLDDTSRSLMLVCLIVAAKTDGVVPNNPDYLQRVGYLSKKPNFKPLIECGFLEILLADASNLHSNALPEVESKSKSKNKKKVVEADSRKSEPAPPEANSPEIPDGSNPVNLSNGSEEPELAVEGRALAIMATTPHPPTPTPPRTAAGPKRRRSQGGSRWPSDAVVSDDWIREGEMRRVEHGLPPARLRLEAERFANYWAAKSGAPATKTDWRRTWLNWATSTKGAGNGQREESTHEQTERVARELCAEWDRNDAANRRENDGFGTLLPASAKDDAGGP